MILPLHLVTLPEGTVYIGSGGGRLSEVDLKVFTALEFSSQLYRTRHGYHVWYRHSIFEDLNCRTYHLAVTEGGTFHTLLLGLLPDLNPPEMRAPDYDF